MDSNYTRVFIGSQVEAQSLVAKLKKVNIIAVVKDEAESARLAGFGSSRASCTEVHVHNDELITAQEVLNETLKS